MSILTKDRIYFLLKDPYWSFIWWDINSWAACETNRDSGTSDHSNPVLVVRVHDVTDIIFDGHNSHRYIDIEGIETSGHWYFQLPGPGRNYCAEIGSKSESGPHLTVIARSNTLFVPRAAPSASYEERWSVYEPA